MKLNKTILKILSLFALTSPIVNAGDCDDLERYFLEQYGKAGVPFDKCKENSNRKIIDL